MKQYSYNGVVYRTHSKKKLLMRLYGRTKNGNIRRTNNLEAKLKLMKLVKE